MCRLRLSFAGAGHAAGIPSGSPWRVFIGARSLAEAPAIDHDTHARIAARGTHRRRHVRAEVVRVLLVVDPPAVLLERTNTVLLEPAMLAGRSETEHPVAKFPGRHRCTEPRFELIPCGVGLERLA